MGDQVGTTGPQPHRSVIVEACDVCLVCLLYWQASDALMPVTTVVTGIVLAVRAAASLPPKPRGG